MAPTTKQTMLETLVTRLQSQMDGDVQSIVGKLQGGDFSTDTANPPTAEYQRYRLASWPDPNKRDEWQQQLTPQDFIGEVLNTLAPDLHPNARKAFMTDLQGGVPYMDAVAHASAVDQAEKLRAMPTAQVAQQPPGGLLAQPPQPPQLPPPGGMG